MIVVDSSVWIALFKGHSNTSVVKLRAIADQGEILIADIVLLEILQGARDERHAEHLESYLRTFTIAQTLGDAIAVLAARNHRTLRGVGSTIRKTPDLILATFCVAHGHRLLHSDRDFAACEQHLGLRCL